MFYFFLGFRIVDLWCNVGLSCLRLGGKLVCLGLRKFLGFGNFNVKMGKVLGKLGKV